MVVCPACSSELVEPATACPRCGLAASLFDPVRGAIAGASGGGRDPQFLAEILRAVGGDPEALVLPPGPATIAQPARFPSARAPSDLRAVPPPRATDLPELPALPPGEPRIVLRRQIDEYLTLARRLGLDVAAFEPRVRNAIRGEDLPAYAEIRQELFVHVAANLAEQLEMLRARRNELALLAPRQLPDEEIGQLGRTLAAGDLARAYRTFRSLQEHLGALEVEWGTIQVLSLEADLLAETVRELGGEPEPALGPVREGRDLARTGDRLDAERMIARGVLALWHLAGPLIVGRIGAMQEAMSADTVRPAAIAFARSELLALGRELRLRNYGAAVLAYRQARDALPPVDAASATGIVAPPAA